MPKTKQSRSPSRKPKPSQRPKPTPKFSELERQLFSSGVQKLAGVDEVGRGCLAGPVVAASFICSTDVILPPVTDSKLISPKKREELYEQLCDVAIAWSVAAVEPAEIDRINIHHASLLAMRQSVQSLKVAPEYLLIDGRFPVQVDVSQQSIIKGDRKCRVIAAASIIAKVWRDRLMTKLQNDYPQFQFAKHKGYGTRQHRQELDRHGPTAIHRKSFRLTSPDTVDGLHRPLNPTV